MSELNIGTDPEYFSTVNVGGTDYAISPALLRKFSGITPVKDDIKHPFYIITKDWGWQQDGAAWESTYYKIFHTAEEIKKTVDESLDALQEYLSKLEFMGNKLSLTKLPVVKLDLPLYKKFADPNSPDYDEAIYQGFIRGCDPDFDAIKTSWVCKTIEYQDDPIRCGGGHIHISGGDNIFFKLHIPAVRLLACSVGNYCVVNSPHPELDAIRAQTYGRPGRFRPQEYKGDVKGVEYRTPSNSWTMFSIDRMEEVISLIYKVYEWLKSSDKTKSVLREFLKDSAEAVQTYNVDKAKEILARI